jgi:hypothetical protein
MLVKVIKTIQRARRPSVEKTHHSAWNSQAVTAPLLAHGWLCQESLIRATELVHEALTTEILQQAV